MRESECMPVLECACIYTSEITSDVDVISALCIVGNRILYYAYICVCIHAMLFYVCENFEK